mmetsp:Transcript_10095/g.23853  ORF Transcript_10095/g.23853 Transcript_10095/m.23853 type:complete len:237 (-) Transcript_10095:147-857(-)
MLLSGVITAVLGKSRRFRSFIEALWDLLWSGPKLTLFLRSSSSCSSMDSLRSFFFGFFSLLDLVFLALALAAFFCSLTEIFITSSSSSLPAGTVSSAAASALAFFFLLDFFSFLVFFLGVIKSAGSTTCDVTFSSTSFSSLSAASLFLEFLLRDLSFFLLDGGLDLGVFSAVLPFLFFLLLLFGGSGISSSSSSSSSSGIEAPSASSSSSSSLDPSSRSTSLPMAAILLWYVLCNS